jgi:hypothetical protein
LVAGGGIAAVAGWVGVLTVARRAEHRREAIDQEIRETASKTTTTDELESQVLGSEAAKKAGGKVVRQRLQHHYADESKFRQDAEGVILDFRPPVPRRAKRMLNRLRVLLVVAVGRRMMDGTPALNGHHLGRWIVLNERWPELAHSVSSQPERLQALEQAHNAATLRDALAGIGDQTPVSAELVRFMRGAPNLAPVLHRLVHLEPAD